MQRDGRRAPWLQSMTLTAALAATLTLGAAEVVAAATAATPAGGAARVVGVLDTGTPIPVAPEKPVVTVPFGDGSGAIRRWQVGEPGEGHPIAFLADERGCMHLLIPHEPAIMVLAADGTVVRKVPLKGKDGGDQRAGCFFFDFALDGTGGWLVLDQARGTVFRFDANGRATANYGTFVCGTNIERLSGGGFVVADAGSSSINLFDDRGRFRGYIRDAKLTAVASPTGAFARTVLVGKHRAFVWLHEPKRKTPRLLGIVDPREGHEWIYEAKPVGFTSNGDVILLTTEANDHTYFSYVLRISADGKVVGQRRLPATMEFSSNLPRFWRLVGDDRVVTFRVGENDYRLVSYEVPPAR